MPPTTTPRKRVGVLATSERPHWVDQRYRTLAPLSREEEAWLIPMAQAGDEVAADRIIRANVRFAVQVASWWCKYNGGLMDDMVPIAVSGLWYGIAGFDPATENRFISWAVWWVRQRLDEDGALLVNTIKRPQNARQADRAFRRIQNQLDREHGYLVSDTMVLEQMEPYKSYSRPPAICSLDQGIDHSTTALGRTDAPGSRTMHESVPDRDGAVDVFANLARAELRRRLGRYLEPGGWNVAGLTERDKEILRRYVGWDGTAPETLDAIGGALGITRERVRQLRDRGLQQIKAHINGHRAEVMELIQ
jgi:RNA polymerase sigma factor (sigma-70 family)